VVLRRLLAELVGTLCRDRAGESRSRHRHVLVRRLVEKVESLPVTRDNRVHCCDEALDVHLQRVGSGVGGQLAVGRQRAISLAAEIRVSAVCRAMGIRRTTYYRLSRSSNN
jgi:hypothetical protein